MVMTSAPRRALFLDGPLRGTVLDLPAYGNAADALPPELSHYLIHRWEAAGRTVLVATIRADGPADADIWDLLVPDRAKLASEQPRAVCPMQATRGKRALACDLDMGHGERTGSPDYHWDAARDERWTAGGRDTRPAPQEDAAPADA
jgi:hypothetical protein